MSAKSSLSVHGVCKIIDWQQRKVYFLKFDAVALGELLIDFTNSECSKQNNLLFEANPGGAPCNVLAMLSKLGKRTAFIGKVGNDIFGRLLRNTLVDLNINCDYLYIDNRANTTLAFVKNADNGERGFSFYRKPGADTLLQKSEIDVSLIRDCKLFHYGSLSLTDDPAKTATKYAVTYAMDKGIMISFDPNLRMTLWPDPQTAKMEISWGCKHCDILKLSVEELYFLTECNSVDSSLESLIANYSNLKLVLITYGEKGSECVYNGNRYRQPAFFERNAIDTTGAGDTFFACCLFHILESSLEKFDSDYINEMLIFANAAAAFIVSKKGALLAMPSINDISNYKSTLQQRFL
jgi:fructokinase